MFWCAPTIFLAWTLQKICNIYVYFTVTKPLRNVKRSVYGQSLSTAFTGEEESPDHRSVDSMGCRPPSAVRDLTRDGRWSTRTYDVSVLKLYNVSFQGRCARMGNTLKLPSLTKLARLSHFPPASQGGPLADSDPVFYVYVFSMVIHYLWVDVWVE